MKNKKLSIVALGEILWDLFPDRACFGGAPANYACATSELSDGRVNVHLVSAVGQDSFGERAIQELKSHGVNTELICQIPNQTGQVKIRLNQSGNAEYEFVENVAWDHLDWTDDLQLAAQQADAICFGTLSQRMSRSAETIQRFVKNTRPDCIRIMDINLRFPHVDDDTILNSIKLCNVLKLNDEELPYLARLFNLPGDERQVIKQLFEITDLELIALTKGPRGATLCCGEQIVDSESKPVEIVDTVGAGDAFTAALTLQLLHDVPIAFHADLEHLAERANQVASFVCTQTGATPKFPDNLKQLDGLF